MKRRLWSAVFCAVVVGSLFAVEIREQKVGGETSRWFEEMVPQADGVRIYTYGSVPAPGVKCPIIIQRNPYVKEERVDMPSFARGQLGTLARGYARVFQHCRGVVICRQTEACRNTDQPHHQTLSELHHRHEN